MIKKIDHMVITTARTNECLAFYQKLGFILKQANGRNELFAGDFKINVHTKGSELLPHAKNVGTGSNDLCFEISGKLTDFVSNLENKGISIELGIVERTGTKGKMQSAYIRDIDGNLIEFCSYE